VIATKQDSKPLQHFYLFLVSQNSLMSYQLESWSKLFMIFWKRKTSYLRKKPCYVITTRYLTWNFSWCY